MTPAEEAEILRLKIRIAEAEAAGGGAPQQTEQTQPSVADSMLAGVQNLGAFGWGDEAGAALQGGLMAATGNGDYLETYRQARGENRDQSKRAKEAHKGAYYAAGLPAAVAASLALPAAKAAQGAGLGVRAGYGALNGILQGGVAGAGESEAGAAGGVAGDAAIGSLLGGALGGILPAAGTVLRAAGGAAARGLIKPGPLVETLKRLGVDTSKLSLGQMAPDSFMAPVEEAGQHALAGGGFIKATREAGNQAWRDAVGAKAMSPYLPSPGGPTSNVLTAARKGFSEIYDDVGAAQLQGAGAGKQSMGDQLRKSFSATVADKGTRATDADRSSLASYLKNQASALQYKPGSPNTASDLMSMRQNIRQELAGELQSATPNQAAVKMLTSAEEAVTQQLEKSLPPQSLSALRSADAAYGPYKTVSAAAFKAGDADVMPQHLTAAVKAASERGDYARGGGGELRELAAAGHEALQAKTPPTGVRALIDAVPFSKHAQAPLAALANTDAGKRVMLGQTATQEKARALIEALRGMGAEEAAAGASRPLPALLQALRQPAFYDAGSITRGPGGALAQGEGQ